ncbi:MAG TPA: diacylglycerol kinase family protein [Cryobacterium sp.]|nr:diacylglycerol kinase family protein [Cryobacterium sp.]
MATSGEKASGRHCAVVYNPTKVDLARLRESVNAAASAAGWAGTEWFSTSTSDPGREATRRALDRGASMVIVAGGDGTVRAAAESLRGSGVSLAIVPSGTGNLLARNLGLPLTSPDAAAAIAFTGVDRPVDLGIASITTDDGETVDHVFLVMAGLGLDAEMIVKTRPALKKQVGWLAYVDAGVRVIPRAEQFHIRYSLGGGAEHQARISTILVVNCGMLPGNLQFLPDARLDDGILDIAVMRPTGVLGWLKIWRRVTWENEALRRRAAGRKIVRHTESSNERLMTTLRSADISIAVDEPQEFELDGDDFGRVRAVLLRADPNALVVRVAAASPAPA